MTERDYLLVSALQRMRAAKDLIAEARPHAALPKTEAAWKRMLEDAEEIFGKLEAEVGRAIEKGWKASG